MTEKLWFLNALDFAALPNTSISSLWVLLAFEQGMNVIWSLDILCPGALSSARWTKVSVGRSFQTELFHLHYTPALEFSHKLINSRNITR
jgi:hypothetical protein